MTTKKMLENWVKDINPKAQITKSDSRCGHLYAVTIDNENLTGYMEISKLEQFLLGVFNAKFFLNKLNDKIL